MKKTLWIVLVALILVIGGGYFYFNTSPSNFAEEAGNSTKKVDVVDDSGFLMFTPLNQNVKESVIFYPGAFIDALSYAPMAKGLADAGYKVYIAEMPLDLAVFGKNKAADIMDTNTDEHFVIGGHSLGGAMAARFAHDNMADLDGIFFLASYADEKGSLAKADFPALSITATRDGVLNWDTYNKNKKYLPENTTFVSIKGGNHAQFGAYGKQNGDNDATISVAKQTEETVTAIKDWLALAVK
ncbi:alpha/beta hydrolase [Listeria booriae]|uniref:Alpha/beta hydrolase n=1 Tax=Listeria booriae TaxID=1552123 RepID=A0A099W8W4_9LIST|nr:alpha/beta hydrolase [Listeria booriae]KGL41427.1 carboxymethylenebutenolidase [Listeria booriae]MBC1316180.1 alpha/beta hydrolase [Listeria booriae]MBC1777322.1 alpha/beta hydrolase [Listeria booriae]MBC1812408.1 alpha/beta hydrolase [Listeria booriae]MBC1888486.1 alpha/beta hydrolase [Listeria booriae]